MTGFATLADRGIWIRPDVHHSGRGLMADLDRLTGANTIEHRFDRPYDEQDPATVLHPNGTAMRVGDRDMAAAVVRAAWLREVA